MKEERITFELSGDVPLHEFAQAITGFEKLVRALSDDVDPAANIRWTIVDLSPGSTHVTALGTAETAEDRDSLTVIGNRLDQFAQDAEEGNLSEWSGPVRESFASIYGVLNGHVKTIGFGTDRGKWSIRQTPDARYMLDVTQYDTSSKIKTRTYGALVGMITRISGDSRMFAGLKQRGSTHTIRCYPDHKKMPDAEKIMRACWLEWVVVEGVINRAVDTGEPMTMSQVSKITQMDVGNRDDVFRARGAVTHDKSDDRTIDDILRQIREG